MEINVGDWVKFRDIPRNRQHTKTFKETWNIRIGEKYKVISVSPDLIGIDGVNGGFYSDRFEIVDEVEELLIKKMEQMNGN